MFLLLCSSEVKRSEGYLEKRADGIHRCWGPQRPVYVDVYDFPLDSRTESGEQPIERLVDLMRARESTKFR